MADDAAPALTLDQHLAKGYDHLVHGKRRDVAWTPAALASALRADADLARRAEAKLKSLSTVMQRRGENSCFVTKTHARVLSDALAKSREPG